MLRGAHFKALLPPVDLANDLNGEHPGDQSDGVGEHPHIGGVDELEGRAGVSLHERDQLPQGCPGQGHPPPSREEGGRGQPVVSVAVVQRIAAQPKIFHHLKGADQIDERNEPVGQGPAAGESRPFRPDEHEIAVRPVQPRQPGDAGARERHQLEHPDHPISRRDRGRFVREQRHARRQPGEQAAVREAGRERGGLERQAGKQEADRPPGHGVPGAARGAQVVGH
jgi:hypothetical protein